MRVVAVLAIVGVVATGCGGADKPPASTPAPTATPSGPLDKTQYQAKLTALEQVLASKARALGAAPSAASADSAISALITELTTQISAIALPDKAPALKSADETLLNGLIAVRNGLQYAVQFGGTANCGGSSYAAGIASVLFSAHLQKASAQLRTAGVTFGSTLVSSSGRAPISTVRNGTILQRSGRAGNDSVEIENSTTDEDMVVSMVPAGTSPKKPQLVVYLRSAATTTVSGLRGDYVLYYQSGLTWSPRLNRFLQSCQFQRLAETFTKDHDWSVRLLPAADPVAGVIKIPAY